MTTIAETQPPRVWNMRDPNCPADAVRIDRQTELGNPVRYWEGWYKSSGG